MKKSVFQNIVLYIPNGMWLLVQQELIFCVYTTHQNVVLMVNVASTGKTYKQLMDKVVCT